MALALACIAAIVVGAGLASSEGVGACTVVLAVVAVVLAWLRALSGTRQTARSNWTLATACVIAIGLVRGLTVGAVQREWVVERGGGLDRADAPLREFEVVGASEPGVRCAIELRHPDDRSGPTLRVLAEPERCPLAAGRRVAVLPRALVGGWRVELQEIDERDLGPGPTLWLRPRPEPRGLARVSERYWTGVASLRQRAWDRTRGDSSASLVAAVGLGLRSALAPDQREQLRASGLGHLIAVSGLHVAVAALWLQALARRGVVLLGGPPSWACVIAWLPLWGYVGLTGAAASAIRAALMLTVIDLATLTGRPSHGPTSLAIVAAGMLVWQPQWLLDPGFALSIAAMAAIVTMPGGLGPLASSWRITWATAPISVLWFDVAPLHGLIANAFALPMFAVLMPLALVAVLAPGGVGQLAMGLAKLVAAPILDLAALLAELPSVGPGALAVLAGIGLLAHRVRRRWRARDEHELTPSWLPPRLCCGLAMAVGLVMVAQAQHERRRPVGPPDFDWVALGSVHSRSLLVADPSAPGSACLYRPTDAAATWLALFELLDVRRVPRLDPGLPDPARGSEALEADPATRALANRLEHAGIELGGPEACVAPSPAAVRAALRACRALQGGYGRALARSHAGEISCRIDDRWVSAGIDADALDE